MLRKDASSSGTKPWVHHTLAVMAAALAMKGRAKVPAAASPSEVRSTERLLSLRMPSSLAFGWRRTTARGSGVKKTSRGLELPPPHGAAGSVEGAAPYFSYRAPASTEKINAAIQKSRLAKRK